VLTTANLNDVLPLGKVHDNIFRRDGFLRWAMFRWTRWFSSSAGIWWRSKSRVV